MMSLNKFVSLLIILGFINEAWCIRCYYCNSENNTACLDVNAYSEDIRSHIVPIVECESAIPNPGGYSFFCRKISQTIFHSHRESDIRVTRGCGWMRHSQPCYRDDNTDHLGISCQCFEDYCNSSDRLDPSTLAILFCFFAGVLYFWR
ncbi:uncharacterized protein LOC106712573 [Papilio machaon]|uniref:uncharacterized protein LOC106712573 n=1 Tax=Papilio machaon TaxID=76193 RepID=UPI001E6635CD|nr:uncharacterized protein LOC106712573 [Papilio machaon]